MNLASEKPASGTIMKIKRPTSEQIDLIAEQFGLNLEFEDIESFKALMEGPIASYERLDELCEPKPEVKYPRSPGYRPSPISPLSLLTNTFRFKPSIASVIGIPLGQTAVHSNIVWHRQTPWSPADACKRCFPDPSRLSDTKAKARFNAAGPR